MKPTFNKIRSGIFWILLMVGSLSAVQIKSIWSTSPEKLLLKNGLTLVYEKDDSSKTTTLQVLVIGGQRGEPAQKAGVAYLTTRLAVNPPDRSKVQELMSQATRVTMFNHADFSRITISCLSKNLDNALKITSKIMLKPLFSGIRIDRIMRQMKQYQAMEEDEPANVAHNAFMKTFFGQTPYAKSIFGSEKSRKSIKKKDITNFFKKHFKSGNIVMAVSSNLNKDIIQKMIKYHFEKIPLGEKLEWAPLEIAQPERQEIFEEKATQQTLVSMGFFLPGTSSSDYVLAVMVDYLLGKGINSKLWSLREVEKLAYNVQSRFTFLRLGGLLEAYLKTDNSKRDTAVAALEKVINEIHQNGISENELQITKTYTKASLLRDNEAKDARIYSLVFFETIGFGYDFLDKIFEEIDSINIDEFNSFLNKHLDPSKSTLVIVGPEDN